MWLVPARSQMTI